MSENERMLQMKLDFMDKQMSKIMTEAATFPFSGSTASFVFRAMTELKKLLETLK